MTVWDTPGQEDFRDAGWGDAFTGMAGSNRCVLINIVSYGHNSTGLVPYAELKRTSPKKAREDVVRNYFRIERQGEIELINELSKQIAEVKCKVHLLTIINKQDLWWSKRDQVLAYYQKGPYAKAVAKIQAGRPKILFAHSLKEVCLCSVNLKTCDGEMLAPTCAGYDATIREFYLSHLLRQLNEVVS